MIQLTYRRSSLYVSTCAALCLVMSAPAWAAPWVAEQHHGRNDFEGTRTQRVYGLPAKARVFDPLILHPRVLPLAQAILDEHLLLSAAHAIWIHSGETRQRLHFDDSFYPVPRPRAAVGVSTIWSIDAFTRANGATHIAPGSHRLGDEGPAEDAETVRVEMPPGSVIVVLGTLYHGGGANTDEASRLGLTFQFCPGWARPQENWFLQLPPNAMREVPQRLRRLLGYEIQPPFMGHVAGRHPDKSLA